MKKLFLITLFFLSLLPNLVAQTERELLLEVIKQQAVTNVKVDKLADQQIELSKQLIELSKQQAVMIGKSEVFEKAIDKRFDDANKRMEMIFNTMLAMLAGIFGLIGFVIWDRQVSIKPILDKNKDLVKEIAELKERELKFEEKTENHFKKIAQIDARFAGIL